MKSAHPPTTEHNYIPRLLESGSLVKSMAGHVHDVQVRHDDWCDIYRGGFCNCEPDIVIQRWQKPPK